MCNLMRNMEYQELTMTEWKNCQEVVKVQLGLWPMHLQWSHPKSKERIRSLVICEVKGGEEGQDGNKHLLAPTLYHSLW